MKSIIISLLFFLVCIKTLTQQWQIEHTNHISTEISAKNSTVCHSVGYSSMEFSNSNDINKWNFTKITGATSGDFEDVSFLNEMNGVACGVDGAFAKTTNGGVTWQYGSIGNMDDYRSICYVNADTIFAAGQDYVRRSVNGGTTWTTSKFVNQESYFGFFPLEFDSSGFGITSNQNTRLVTSDWGTNWTTYSGAYGLLQVLTPQLIYGIRDSADVNILRRSVDGGITFNTTMDVDRPSTMCFLDSLTGWLVADSTLDKTIDGGYFWFPLTHPHPTQYPTNHFDISFSDAMHGWFVFDHRLYYYTSDGGFTWTIIPSPNIGGAGELTSIDVQSDSIWYLSSTNNFLRSTDGGLNWNDESGISNATSVFVLAPDTIIIAGNSSGSPIKSTDGGSSDYWSFLNGATCVRSYFKDNNNGFVAGGLLRKTTNGGNSWTTIAGNGAFDFYWVNDDVAYAISYYYLTNADVGKILKTTDGGNTWPTIADSLNIPPSFLLDNILSTLHFNNEQVGWICGPQVYIARTDDGGLNWTTQNSGTIVTINDVYFKDNFNGWACGDGGILLETIDGGTTWTQAPLLIAVNLNSILVFENDVYVSGSSGTILSYTVPPEIIEPGDLNGDEIGVGDILIFNSDFGCIGEDCVGDFNGDGITNIFDLLLFIS